MYRQMNRQKIDRRKRETIFFSYSKSHETSRKQETAKSPDGLSYYTSLTYAWEVEIEEGLKLFIEIVSLLISHVEWDTLYFMIFSK